MALCAVLILVCGCVLPQEDQSLGDFVVKNRPPRIVENTALNPGLLRTRRGSNCPAIEFSALVEDPDIDDVLRYRWYLDYDPTQQFRKLPYSDGKVQRNGETSATVTIQPLPNHDQFPVLKNTDTHVVTLLVTDGTLDATQGPGSRPDPDRIPLSDGGIALNERYAVTYSWIVDFDPSEPCLDTVQQ